MIVATLHPQPDAPSSVRKLPASKPQPVEVPPLSFEATGAIERAVVRAIAPERYKLQVTIGVETRAKLRRAQDLLRHTNRGADEAAVIDRALTLLVRQLEKVKYGRTDRPLPARRADPGSRYVPTHVRRAVSARDGDRCAFVGLDGRCTETAGLQFHHRIPFADGGPTTVDNLELRCAPHNSYEAERWFGPLFVRERHEEWGELGLDQVRLNRMSRGRSLRLDRISIETEGARAAD